MTATEQDLLTLIGQKVLFHGQRCEVIELIDKNELVLQVLQSDKNTIQASQYGEGHRSVPTTYVLSVFDAQGQFSGEMLASGLVGLLVKD